MSILNSTSHIPVMLEEVLTYLDIKPNCVYFDGTFGAGGYSRSILERADCSQILSKTGKEGSNQE